ncbi:MAG TPA: DinB family protein [Micromonosporaceae bacterium]|nr:DinB family protein [Micromonosporaceae bacterium]
MDPNGVEVMDRPRPAQDADERDTLAGVLDFLRATVVNKVAGLTDQNALSQAVPPSALSAAGVVRHLTGVERFWFSIDFAGSDLPWPWTENDPHGNFRPHKTETLASIVAGYRAECARSREVVASASLDDIARTEGMAFKLRYAMVHMIEETARHCGHLDLLRERIDGVTGE